VQRVDPQPVAQPPAPARRPVYAGGHRPGWHFGLHCRQPDNHRDERSNPWHACNNDETAGKADLFKRENRLGFAPEMLLRSFQN
jgi:hypothetical protein